MNGEDRATDSLRLFLEGNSIRFFASTRDYGNDWCFVLLDLDPETQKENVLLTSPGGALWADFSLSPNKKRVALPGPGETERELGSKAGLTVVRIADLETGKSRLLPLKFESEWSGIHVERVVWLTNDTLAIKLEGSIGFFIASVDKAGP